MTDMPPLLWAMLVLWGLLLFGGAALGAWNSERTHRMPTWARIASSFVVVLLAWALRLILGGRAVETYSLLIALGMTFGFAGDVFMARLLPVRGPVLGGIGAFALGHVIYIAAILGLGDRLALNAPALRLGAWLGLLVAGAVSWYLVVWRGARQKSMLHIAALPYAMLLASTAGFGLGLALQDASFAPLALGGLLFLLSDLLLAAQIFNDLHFNGIGDVIWLTYGPAQMLIVTSTLAAVGM